MKKLPLYTTIFNAVEIASTAPKRILMQSFLFAEVIISQFTCANGIKPAELTQPTHSRRLMSMIRKFLLSASIAGLLVLGLSAQARTITTQSQSEKQSQATKSVSGKVMSIGNGGHSFTLEVSGDTNNKRSMDFVVDKNTQVQGQVREGTPVTVEYQAMENGQYLALSITAQA